MLGNGSGGGGGVTLAWVVIPEMEMQIASGPRTQQEGEAPTLLMHVLIGAHQESTFWMLSKMCHT